MDEAAPNLFNLVYISREAAPMSREALLALLEQSRPKNERLGLTGLLVHKAGHFLQILEGPREVVEPLMEVISRDPRHTDVAVLVRDEIKERRFGQWAMALADWPDEDVDATRAWFALLEEFRKSGGRFGPASGLVDFARSLVVAGYLE